MASSIDYLIVGAGVFGALTALHLIQQKPQVTIILIDRTPFPNPLSASHDRSKIVRADYADLFYMSKALESQREWRDNPLYQRHYHETGIAFAENVRTSKAAIENYKTLSLDVPAKVLHLEDTRKHQGGVFENTNWNSAEGIYWNPQSGYVDAEGALRDVIQEAVSKGVKYREATVLKLILDDNGACTRVCTKNGDLHVDHVLLCTRAFTAQLLANTAPTNKEMQVSGRLVAAGAASGTARVATELIAKFKDAPVFFIGLDHTHGESVPVNKEGQLKFNYEDSFTRMTLYGSSEDIPKGLRDIVDTVARNIYGDRVYIDSYRICWDAITLNEEFMICPHPHSRNLYLATGGSFHGQKFLPIIGKYVLQMLNGSLGKTAGDRWAWDRDNTGSVCKMYALVKDIKDIVGGSI